MKKTRLISPFCGVVLWICVEILSFGCANSRDINLSLLSNSPIVPLAMITFSWVQCTSFQPQSRASTSNVGIGIEESREPRLIRELTMMNKQSCLSKILCGVEVAKPPSSKSSTINDYAFLVKSFFDTLLSDDEKAETKTKKKKTTTKPKKSEIEKKPLTEKLDDEDESDEYEKDKEDDLKIFRSQIRRKNSRLPFFGHEAEEFSKPLEQLLDEPDGFSFFRKRLGKSDNLILQTNCTTNCTTRPSVGYLGYSNPRFDKSAFLSRKQLQIEQAPTDQQKLLIASEVATKLRSPRQCRLLNWLRPSYTTTTTITTTSNDPSIMQISNNAVTNTMCPFTVGELQNMITGYTQVATTTTESSSIYKYKPKPLFPFSTTFPPPTYQIIKLPSQLADVKETEATPTKSHPSDTKIQKYQVIHKKPAKHHLTIYGESDPDLSLQDDPLYSLVPPGDTQSTELPQAAHPHLTSHFNNLALAFPDKLMTSGTGPQKVIHSLDLQPQSIPDEQQQRHSNFYLNSEGPTEKKSPPPPPPPRKVKVLSTTVKPAPSKEDSSQEDEENNDEISNEDEQNDENIHQFERTPSSSSSSMSHSGGTRNMFSSLNKKINFRFPNKIRVSLPSIRGIAAKLMKPSESQQFPHPLEPNDNQSEEESREHRGNKRETTIFVNQQQQHPASLRLKSSLEFQEKVRDQNRPPFIFRQPRPQTHYLQQHHKLTPAHSNSPNKQKPENDEEYSNEEDKEEEEDEEKGGKDSDENASNDNSEEEQAKNKRKEQKDSPEDDSLEDPYSPPSPKSYETQQSTQSPTTTPSTRRPIWSVGFPKLFRSKTTTTTTPKPTTPLQPSKESSNATSGIFKHILSDHGLRTLSTIQNMFYGPKQDESHPHPHASDSPPSPSPRKKQRRPPPPPPPPPPRRRRPKPNRKPQDDESVEDDVSDESEEEEDDEPKKEKQKKQPQLPPVQLPPKIIAVPIYVEGKESWDGVYRPQEEEFFDLNPLKQQKPEKYDYDDASAESKEAAIAANSGEHVDFGPGQNIQTHYSDIVDKVREPGKPGGGGGSETYVLGLPTTWEDIYKDYKNKKKAQSSSDEESEEEKDGPRRKVVLRRRPTVRPLYEYDDYHQPPQHPMDNHNHKLPSEPID